MKNHRLVFLAVFSLVFGHHVPAASAFDEWAEGFAAEWVRSKPQVATRTQYFSGAEQDAMDRQLGLFGAFGGSLGVKAARAQAALARRGLDEMRRFPTPELTPQQQTSAAIIRWTLDDVIASSEFAANRFVFDQFTGLHLGMVTFLTTIHPIRNARDVENYLARLALVATLIDEGIGEARAAADAGVLPPRFVLQRAIEQLDGIL